MIRLGPAWSAGLVISLIIVTSFITTLVFLPVFEELHPRLVKESPFVYTFNSSEILNEATRAGESTSPYWFLDSGGELILANGIGKTIQGALGPDDRWRVTYAASNPQDTDDGYHPQNIFRLVTKSSWVNASMEALFRITNDNLSDSPNRNASNGLLLMSRYQDHDTLYYAGIRVDGSAVIKKKYKGAYYTMAQAQVFPGSYGAAHPNLLPHNEWIGLRSMTETNADGSVSVYLFMQRAGGAWTPVVSATDNGSFDKTPPIASAGLDGIRTDFMDVELKDVRISPL